MEDAVIEVVRRQASAAEEVEVGLRALELVVAAGQERFLGMAVDDVEAAMDRLAALEVARAIAVDSGGLPVGATAAELADRIEDPGRAAALRTEVDGLRSAVDRLEEARHRAERAVGAAAGRSRTRLDAAVALTDPP